MFFLTSTELEQYMPFIMVGVLLLVGVLIFAIALAITKAEVKTNAKWVFGSFFLQVSVIFFISVPLMLSGITGDLDNEGIDRGLIAAVIIFSAFIDVNVINVIHKLGIKKSTVVVLLIIIPISGAMYLLGDNMDKLISLL